MLKINSGFSRTGFVFFGNLYFFRYNGEFQMCLNRQVDSIRITLQRRNLHQTENGLVRFSVNRVLNPIEKVLNITKRRYESLLNNKFSPLSPLVKQS